jgi:hypothetical protein
VNCCYAKSDKYWYTDPTGVAWETYRSLGQVEFFGDEHVQGDAGAACCAPAAAPVKIVRSNSSNCCA